MIIDTEFIHLAKWQMKQLEKANRIRTDRELIQEFGRINELEEELIWKNEFGKYNMDQV